MWGRRWSLFWKAAARLRPRHSHVVSSVLPVADRGNSAHFDEITASRLMRFIRSGVSGFIAAAKLVWDADGLRCFFVCPPHSHVGARSPSGMSPAGAGVSDTRAASLAGPPSPSAYHRAGRGARDLQRVLSALSGRALRPVWWLLAGEVPVSR